MVVVKVQVVAVHRESEHLLIVEVDQEAALPACQEEPGEEAADGQG